MLRFQLLFGTLIFVTTATVSSLIFTVDIPFTASVVFPAMDRESRAVARNSTLDFTMEQSMPTRRDPYKSLIGKKHRESPEHILASFSRLSL